MIKRRSKISKLPKDIRNQVNVMLDEEATYQTIIDWLESKGYSGFTGDCLYQWKEGGFQDWLNKQAQLESARSLREWATTAHAEGQAVSLPLAYVTFAGAQLKTLLDQFDALQAKGSLVEHPEEYARLFNSFARFAKLAFEMEKTEKMIALRRDLQRLAVGKDGEPVGGGGMEEIEKRLKLM